VQAGQVPPLPDNGCQLTIGTRVRAHMRDTIPSPVSAVQGQGEGTHARYDGIALRQLGLC